MVGVVQLAEHWIVVPGVVGSSPITHPIKKRVALATLFFIWVFVGDGTRKPDPGKAGVSNSPVDCCLGRGRVHGPGSAVR